MTKDATFRGWVPALGLALAAGGAQAQDFDLDALIEAARAEPPLAVFDSTGKIVEMAEAFAAEYGLEAVGQKVKAEEQLEMMAREAIAGNVQGDVSIISDAPAAIAQLLPNGFAESWVPPDLADSILPEYQDPLVVVTMANVWTYNTEIYDACPVSNVWELTEPEWRGRVAMQDPLGKSVYTDWFNQMQSHGDAEMAAAFEAHFGTAPDLSEMSATEQWVAALAANAPLLGSSDSNAGEAVGAPGQSEGFIGLMSSAKYRDNADSDYRLGLCADMQPWIGFTNAGVGLIASGTDSPNAARLFMRWVLTPEGIAPQAEDGKMSSNTEVGLPDDEPSGIGASWNRLLTYDMSTALDDWDSRQDWQDFWRLNYVR
ncbi:ABC transporter substrate-binding protein [Wenxinia marina]|uniref:ABC-type Fe3+ transport system, periplasmic component n=1 Tax=Wenxinia marina DSM 24838 TaxID=1123501 RepID=A0A0D0Q756_9RHOB|nr:ABC transporter substrate-binding protein [Wenxinia marina]KIQ70239.1 ABC-type Fe3+ transport system, periplasmic component [Wenxinia marina DSM 24838]GGL50117.1 ABC transporter substrate-binding protein [Wenxinia marina]